MNIANAIRTVVASTSVIGVLASSTSLAADPTKIPLPDIPVISSIRNDPSAKPADKAKTEPDKNKKADDEKEKDKDKEKKAEDEKEKKLVWKAWEPPGQTLTLAGCLRIGHERQPAIVAAQASLAASEQGYLALFGLRRIADFIRPDLPVRKRQAERGLSAAASEILKTQQENVYDVSLLYFGYVYATQQEQTASEIVEQLETFYENAVEFLKLEVPDPKVKINEFTLGALDGVISGVRELRDKASTGRKKALAALKEAMGVEQTFDFVPATKELPLMRGEVSLEQVIAHATCRRPELVQAAVVLDVTRLEVLAQGMNKRGQKVETFTSGTDIHARHIPAPLRNGEYRPGAVPPEMPGELVGKVEDRVARAEQYVRHQEACYAKALGLVKLEATNAFLNYKAAEARVKDSKEVHERQQKLVEKSRAAAAAKMDPEVLVRNEVLANQAQARYVEAVHDQVKALITLEKVCGGGVIPSFPGR
jgi:hypothetical protein